MSTVEAVLMMAFLLPSLIAISWAREELRLVEPRTRFGFGIAAFFGSTAIFFAMMKLLPKPAEIEGDLLFLTLLMGGASVVGGAVILAIVLIGSAAWQAFKRWKFHRSNVG